MNLQLSALIHYFLKNTFYSVVVLVQVSREPDVQVYISNCSRARQQRGGGHEGAQRHHGQRGAHAEMEAHQKVKLLAPMYL